jgi:mono/diheme cytochrome c family protein
MKGVGTRMHDMKRLFRSVALVVVALSFSARVRAADPVLLLKSGAREIHYSRSALLKRKDVETVTIENDPSYPGAPRRYRAVKAAALFAELPRQDGDVLQFKCLDGFSAPISIDKVLNAAPDKAVAFVAIEPAEVPWPKLARVKGTAGPFYLVWQHPERSSIGSEEWPFQLASFEVRGSVASRFPAILPDPALAPDHIAQRGFAVFQKTCFACHTVNGQGEARVGPDLNWPMNPTEYFQEAALRKLIRNPQSLRHWTDSRMPGFDEKTLSPTELDELLAYLRHMSHRKQAPKES